IERYTRNDGLREERTSSHFDVNGPLATGGLVRRIAEMTSVENLPELDRYGHNHPLGRSITWPVERGMGSLANRLPREVLAGQRGACRKIVSRDPDSHFIRFRPTRLKVQVALRLGERLEP